MELIDKDDLYGDKYNAFVLCEYTREMKLIKRLIEIAEAGVSKKSTYDTWSFDGVCYQFAKTIVDYSKMAYDNLVLGHFHATTLTPGNTFVTSLTSNSSSAIVKLLSQWPAHARHLKNGAAALLQQPHPKHFHALIKQPLYATTVN